MPKRGFTLIELLVVIAIIAILAAILFPVFAKAKDNAKSATCQSNLRQVMFAVLSYADSYGGWLPGLNVYMQATGGGGNIVDVRGDAKKGALYKYLGRNRKIIMCPSDARWKTAGFNSQDYFSYSINSYATWVGIGYVSSKSWSDQRYKCNVSGVSLGLFPRPSRTVYLVEENDAINDALFHDVDLTSDRHMGWSNVGYIDGHCRRVGGKISQSGGRFQDGSYVFHP